MSFIHSIDLTQFNAHAAAAKSPALFFKKFLQEQKNQLRLAFETGAAATQLVASLTACVDQILISAWQLEGCDQHELSLAAVGGYGRGELHPGSDVDILIIHPQELTPVCGQKIERFLLVLWDSGLDISHSVRSVEECITQAQQDITVITNITESRLIIGSQALFLSMQEQTGPTHIWPSKTFFQAKRAEQIQRYKKYDDTAYNLEPNIKEGPGGLRDFQLIGWVAKRHFGTHQLQELVNHEFLTEQEMHQLQDCMQLLWKIRFALHVRTGRKEDRLLFDHQKALAELFGYQDTEERLAVEKFMQLYYRTVQELSRLNEMLLQHFEEAILYPDENAEPIIINAHFESLKGFIDFRHANVIRDAPSSLLEIFLLLEQMPQLKGVRASAIRLIRSHTSLIDEAFRHDIVNKTLFMAIVRNPRGLTHQLRRMNRYGVLAAYIPAFGNIVGRMQYDLFHVYTVDEHTLFVVRNLRRFTVPEYASEFPLASEIINHLEKPELVYLAGLFHDIAKGRGGDHSQLGAQDAEEFCVQHGLPPQDIRLVRWLVENHLFLSTTAQKKDISDPEVIRDFAAKMGDVKHLNFLYLLTVADIRATSPKLWNSWKNSLLISLYEVTKSTLQRGLENPIDKEQIINETKAGAQALLANIPISPADMQAIWNRFPADYFLRYSAEEVFWHTKSIFSKNAPIVEAHYNPIRASTEIFIYARSDAFSFAKITGVFEQLGLTIMDARIVLSKDQFTLDTYLVLEENGTAIVCDFRIKEIQDSIANRLQQTGNTLSPVYRQESRQAKHFPIPTQIFFRNDPHNRRTVMEIITSDYPGMLSNIARAIVETGLTVENARIATFGNRVEDVFFILDPKEGIVSDALQQQLDTNIRSAL